MYDRASLFEGIYNRNDWNGTVTRAGPGSTIPATKGIAGALTIFFQDAGIESVLDAGCNEGYWQPDWPGYVGIDIVPEAIEVARVHHPDRKFIVADMCADPLPPVEAVICRDALQHMSLAEGMSAIENFRRTGAWLLLAGSFVQGLNVDIATGDYYEPDLTSPPFSLGEPFVQFEDGTWDSGVRWPGKYLMGFRL